MSVLQNNFEINRVTQKILSQVGQQKGGFPWISAYLDTNGGLKGTEKLKYLLNQKKAELKRADEFQSHFAEVKRAWKVLTTEIKRAGSQNASLLLYHCPGCHYLTSVYLPVAPKENYLGVGERPQMKPLDGLLHETQASLCLVLEPEQAFVYSLFLNQAPEKWKLRHDSLRSSGDFWVLPRYQRSVSEDGVNYLRHLALIVDHFLKQYEHNKVLVFGDESSCGRLAKNIPGQFQELIEYNVIDWSGDNHIDDEDVIESEVKIKVDALGVLKRLSGDGMSAIGIDRVLEAVREGAVRELLVGESVEMPGWECPMCLSIGYGENGECKYCNTPAKIVDNLKELVMGRIRRNGGKVYEVSDEQLPEEFDGIVALLRYPLGGINGESEVYI